MITITEIRIWFGHTQMTIMISNRHSLWYPIVYRPYIIWIPAILNHLPKPIKNKQLQRENLMLRLFWVCMCINIDFRIKKYLIIANRDIKFTKANLIINSNNKSKWFWNLLLDDLLYVSKNSTQNLESPLFPLMQPSLLTYLAVEFSLIFQYLNWK